MGRRAIRKGSPAGHYTRENGRSAHQIPVRAGHPLGHAPAAEERRAGTSLDAWIGVVEVRGERA
jgi:hypothetical protein